MVLKRTGEFLFGFPVLAEGNASPASSPQTAPAQSGLTTSSSPLEAKQPSPPEAKQPSATQSPASPPVSNPAPTANPESPRNFAPAKSAGIGVAFKYSTRGGMLVGAVTRGGPADFAGIAPGDTLLTVDGIDLASLPGDTVARLITGPIGSTVDIGVAKANGERYLLSIQRGAARPPALSQAPPLSPRLGADLRLPDSQSSLRELSLPPMRSDPYSSVSTNDLLSRYLQKDKLDPVLARDRYVAAERDLSANLNLTPRNQDEPHFDMSSARRAPFTAPLATSDPMHGRFGSPRRVGDYTQEDEYERHLAKAVASAASVLEQSNSYRGASMLSRSQLLDGPSMSATFDRYGSGSMSTRGDFSYRRAGDITSRNLHQSQPRPGAYASAVVGAGLSSEGYGSSAYGTAGYGSSVDVRYPNTPRMTRAYSGAFDIYSGATSAGTPRYDSYSARGILGYPGGYAAGLTARRAY